MKRLHNKQKGASVLEFLIVIPVFLLFAFTAVEFGGVFVRANTLTKSVQSAARFLSDVHNNPSYPTADSIASNLVLYGSVTNTGTTILPGSFEAPVITHDYGTDADHVMVSVIYHHTPVGGDALSNLLQLITGATIDLSIDIPASSVMRYAQ